MEHEKNVNVGDTDENQNLDQTNKPGDTPVKSDENMIPKARFDQLNEQKKAALSELKEVADLLTEDVPEDYRDLVPDLGPAQKIAWIRNAIKKGIFDKQVNNGLDTRQPIGKPAVNYADMDVQQKLRAGYKT
ncbi:MAG TPA: hypothetical protein PLS62_11215 [Desulfobacteraceae bacterium]|nr:hypothetical protein [Desulfobacteraceae bacterium]